ncbi:hypothetical protein J1N35_000851 [Gossypium stocksii]|uniref:Malectin-like domain-containing protein n=1 Tax=Gossypium stocksii TaxID=47602 RepID=A0A9D3WJ46_9ROSI|nr:hypothetical protein J1N35_000851 [Gossypium stocksii]
MWLVFLTRSSPIPLTSGPKFIRLHFYPTLYLSFNDPSKKAFFSVQACPFTLLRNFNASLHAVPNVPLIKEFCTNVEGQRLNLTFTPSPDITDSYAFINAIEVVSMPTNLYYTPDGDEGVPFIAQGIMYTLGNNAALEMMYRVDVGGREIPPNGDTGMFWGWSSDDRYLTIAKPSVVPVNISINPNFSSIPSYSAPKEVYITARTMGMNKTQNKNYQLTWEFPVDSGFNYFVRLHFCEFQPEITKEGDRVFEISLTNLTAETEADITRWSGGNGIPFYQDYAVAIETKGNQKKQHLSIALHTSPERRTLYSDAILNGLEIFKLSNNFDLTGPSFDLIGPNVHHVKQPVMQLGKKRTAIVALVAPIFGFITFSLLLFVIFQRCSNKFANNSTPVPPSDICSRFSLREIKTATNNFDVNFIIERGGFGEVYKRFANAGSTPVAIKRLNPGTKI